MVSGKHIHSWGATPGSPKGGLSTKIKQCKTEVESYAHCVQDSPRTASHLESGNADNTKSEAKGEGNQKSLDGEYPLHIKIDDILSDTQSDIEIPASSELVAESQGRDCGRVIPSLPERRAKARQRLLQSKAYAELIEDRIQDLEQKYRVISKKLNVNTGTSKYINYLAENTQSIPKISKMGWVDFTHRLTINPGTLTGAWKHRPEVNEKPTAAIELLVEQPVPDPNHTRYRSSTQPAASLPTLRPSDCSAEPYQIRIRSKPLLKILSHITGCGVAIGPHQHRLLMMRPFKLLVYFEKDIKNYLRNCEAQLQGSNNDNDVIPEQGTKEKSSVSAPSEKRIEGSAFWVENNQSQLVVDHLKLLCNMIDEHLNRPIQLQRCINPNIVKVSFNELWYIFKPGHEVRTSGDTRIQLYRVVKVTGGRRGFKQMHFDYDQLRRTFPENHPHNKFKEEGFSEGSFIIECFYIDFNGVGFGAVNKAFQIRSFEGERDIKSLPVVPLQCYSNETEIRKRLEERGKRFVEFSSSAAKAHRQYKGLTLDMNAEQVESEVIIDFELALIPMEIQKPVFGVRNKLVDDDSSEFREFFRYGHICEIPGCCGNEITFQDYQVDQVERNRVMETYKYLIDGNRESSDQLRADHIILLPPHVYGFVLRTRRWATFDIDCLEDIASSNEGWKNLVLNDDIKNTILALVKNHERPRESQTTIGSTVPSVDLVKGKGRGLIILLHGAPGVGKTSTAECVATLTGRPLFPITCGDIGDTAEDVEYNLEKNFQLAHKWGCVLLLDEADVFLSARTADDVRRNAIVSVFLRSLEYYSGILFLTTNRVGRIDRAFKSRIHVSLLYKKLNWNRTNQIWKNNLKRVEKEYVALGKKIICRDKEILEFAKEQYQEQKDSKGRVIIWNGRQIRNAFQTATAIAAYDASQESGNGIPILDASQFAKVARTAKEFDKYLYKASLHTEDELARMALERDDNYTSSSEDGTRRYRGRSKRNKKKQSKKRKNYRRNMSDKDSEDAEEKSEESSDAESSDSNSSSEVIQEEDRRPTKKHRRR